MSATAGIAAEADYEVSGSDSHAIYQPSKGVLDRYDISYKVGYNAANVATADADLYIASAGEDLRNPKFNT